MAIIIFIFFLSFANLVSGYCFECCAKNSNKMVQGTLNLVAFYYLYTAINLCIHTILCLKLGSWTLFQQLKRLDNCRWVRPSEVAKGGNEEEAKTPVSYQHYMQPYTYVHTIMCLKPGTWMLCFKSWRELTADGWEQVKSAKVGMKRKQRQRYVINTGFKFLIKRNKFKDIYDNLDFCFPVNVFSTEFWIKCLHCWLFDRG